MRVDTIRRTMSDGTLVEHQKGVPFCEVCMAYATFGFTMTINNKRKRWWYCADHRDEGEKQFASAT